MDKLSYFDTLANLVPGIVAIWGITILFPGDAEQITVLFSSPILGPIVYVSIAFVIGNLIQFLSKIIVEPLLKRAFWRGHFYSEIFLVTSMGRLTTEDHEAFVASAKTKLGIPPSALEHLSREPSAEEPLPEATLELSHFIYRVADARTQDDGIALKAHTQNVFYSLYRNLSFLFLLAATVTTTNALCSQASAKEFPWIVLAFELGLTITFFLRARQRGEAYVKGLFWSLAGTKLSAPHDAGA